MLVDPEMIVRFEAVFPVVSNFDSMQLKFKRELERELIDIKNVGLRDMEACIRRMVKVCIIDAETMKNKCDSC